MYRNSTVVSSLCPHVFLFSLNAKTAGDQNSPAVFYKLLFLYFQMYDTARRNVELKSLFSHLRTVKGDCLNLIRMVKCIPIPYVSGQYFSLCFLNLSSTYFCLDIISFISGSVGDRDMQSAVFVNGNRLR